MKKPKGKNPAGPAAKRRIAVDKFVIGWREWIALPDLSIVTIKAKIDTGARSSALHAFNLRTTSHGSVQYITFDVHPMQRNSHHTVTATAELIDMRRVRNSSGDTELRPVIRTTLSLGDLAWPIEVTLARRDTMGFRMLLGRQAIRGKAVIDPARSYLLKRNRNK